MLRALPPHRGFTLIEMMIGLAILALLLAFGVPAFSTMLQNQKLRAGAEGVLSGLQAARAEAVKRNSVVEFVLTDDDVTAGETNAITASTTGKNWMVRALVPATGNYEFVESKSTEGSLQAEGSAAAVILTGSTAQVSFNGFGTTSLAAAATFAVTNPSGGACAPTGSMRCLNVLVAPGGQVRMCDPAVSAAGDTRRC